MTVAEWLLVTSVISTACTNVNGELSQMCFTSVADKKIKLYSVFHKLV